MWGQFIIGYMGYDSLICVMKFSVTSWDNRAVLQCGTGIEDSVTRFGFETGTLRSDKKKNTQTSKQTS
jgi:hypothetical protein